MAKKKPFVLRLDEETFAAIEKWAADEFRSSNGQIEWILSQALQKAGRLKKQGQLPTDQKDNTQG
jgi:hypothetical protein